MYRGEIVALVDGPTAQREEIGLLMATGRRDPEALAAAATSMTAAAEIEAAPVEAVAATVDASRAAATPAEPAASDRALADAVAGRGCPRGARCSRGAGCSEPRRRRRGGPAMSLLNRFVALSAIPIVVDLAGAAGRRGHHHAVEPRRPRARSNFLLPLVAYESLLQGATGLSFLDVDGGTGLVRPLDRPGAGGPLADQHARRGRAAGPDRPGRGRRLQGRPVQHRRHRPGARRRVLRGAGRGRRRRTSRRSSRSRSRSLPACWAARLYGFIPGALKAFTGAHEVVTTIMLNSLAAFAIVGLVNDIFKIQGPTFARTADVGNAAMPILFGRDGSSRFLIALRRAASIAYVLIYRTTLGFEIRTVGANPSAARYAGHEPAAADHPDDEPVRPVRRRWPARSRSSRSATTRPSSGRRSASPASPSRCSVGPTRRDPARRAAARRDAGRRAGDADHGRHPDRDHRRDPGPDPDLPRRRDGDPPRASGSAPTG